VPYGYIPQSGRIMIDGPAAVLVENQDVKEFYFGMSFVGLKSVRNRNSIAAASGGFDPAQD